MRTEEVLLYHYESSEFLVITSAVDLIIRGPIDNYVHGFEENRAFFLLELEIETRVEIKLYVVVKELREVKQ